MIPSLRGGGTEISNVRLANCLAGRGIPVDLVVLQASGPWKARLESTVRLVDLKVSRARWGLPPLFRYLRATNPAAMMTGPANVGSLAIVARMLSRATTRLLVIERNDWRARRAHTGLRGERLALWGMRTTYRFADHRLAVSRGAADSLAREIGADRSRVDVLYNGIDVENVDRLLREPISHRWFDELDIPVFLAAGRLVPQKAYPELLQAFSSLVRRRPARLLIFGEGPLRAAVENGIRHRRLEGAVELLGFRPNLFPWMARASAFVQASLFEGFPVAILEALACGAPVVATDCPSGPGEILQGGEFGLLVPPGDPEALAEAMERVLVDRPLRQRLHEKGPARAREFSIERTADRLLEILAGLRVRFEGAES
jgi:glycosyltransferase involved in cell wall biosynthesis